MEAYKSFISRSCLQPQICLLVTFSASSSLWPKLIHAYVAQCKFASISNGKKKKNAQLVAPNQSHWFHFRFAASLSCKLQVACKLGRVNRQYQGELSSRATWALVSPANFAFRSRAADAMEPIQSSIASSIAPGLNLRCWAKSCNTSQCCSTFHYSH